MGTSQTKGRGRVDVRALGGLRRWEQLLRNDPTTGSPYGSRDYVQVGTRTGPSVPPAGSGRASVGPREGVSETQKQVLAGSVQVCPLSAEAAIPVASQMTDRKPKLHNERKTKIEAEKAGACQEVTAYQVGLRAGLGSAKRGTGSFMSGLL